MVEKDLAEVQSTAAHSMPDNEVPSIVEIHDVSAQTNKPYCEETLVPAPAEISAMEREVDEIRGASESDESADETNRIVEEEPPLVNDEGDDFVQFNFDFASPNPIQEKALHLKPVQLEHLQEYDDNIIDDASSTSSVVIIKSTTKQQHHDHREGCCGLNSKDSTFENDKFEWTDSSAINY